MLFEVWTEFLHAETSLLECRPHGGDAAVLPIEWIGDGDLVGEVVASKSVESRALNQSSPWQSPRTRAHACHERLAVRHVRQPRIWARAEARLSGVMDELFQSFLIGPHVSGQSVHDVRYVKGVDIRDRRGQLLGMEWFTVDKSGLAKLLEKKGKAFAIFELIQNAWDTDATRVSVQIDPIPGRPYVTIRVEDDHPDGFATLTHAFTLFAESNKKTDPSKRGRFNLGEKLVLALCDHAYIRSTRGSVEFDATGRHEKVRERTERGSVFVGTLRMTRDELADVDRAVRTLLPPPGIVTVFNDMVLTERPVVKDFEATLPTEIADQEGYLRRTQRICRVTVHDVLDGEVPTLYEMGIPVVALSGGERWHVNVGQKIPLNVDRDNVTPAYLQTVRVLLANEVRDLLGQADAGQVWVNAATEDERIAPAVVETVLTARFGEKRAVFDPSDQEANKALMNDGYTIIPGGALSRAQWSNVRAGGFAVPSGKIRPTGIQYSGEGKPETVIDPERYTPGQRGLVEYARDLAWKLIGRDVEVRIVSDITRPFAAWYGERRLTLNLGRLGKAWFEEGVGRSQNELLVHELAHDKVSDHLTRDFSDEVGRLGCKLADLVYADPTFFRCHDYRPVRR